MEPMKLGVFTVLWGDQSLDQVVDRLVALGVDAMEIGVANYPETAHLDELTTDEKIDAFVSRLAEEHITISALSCHGNPIHPDAAVAAKSEQGWQKTLQWAKRLNVRTVNVFSGCPGTPQGGGYPNWVTIAWPPDYKELLEWQWKEKVVPYWRAAVETAGRFGFDQIAFEMHPGFVVYNPYTLLKLRSVVGPQIGANFDPSHLFWQGIDPVVAIRELQNHQALFHVHAKDVYVDPSVTALDGVLDTRPYEQIKERAWTFCTVGYGHSALVWSQVINELRKGGYDGALSIEHEDGLASRDEGLERAVRFLKPLLWREAPAAMWWA
jgi:sugar phosphate isomerase/epimerase